MNIEKKILDIRKKILQVAYYSGKRAHIGGTLSMLDIISVLYLEKIKYDFDNPRWEDRDIFVLSKGHCVLGLYAVFNEMGLISDEELLTYMKNNTRLASPCVMNIDIGIENTGGSLGQGISMAVGIAKSFKLMNSIIKVYVMIGDGECNEGSVWEAAMLATNWELDNLTIILDYNKLQSDDASLDIIDMKDASTKWSSFGFFVKEIDGHDISQIRQAFDSKIENKPKIIIGHTIKGKGISFMENNNDWHHNRLTKSLYEKAINELEEMK